MNRCDLKLRQWTYLSVKNVDVNRCEDILILGRMHKTKRASKTMSRVAIKRR